MVASIAVILGKLPTVAQPFPSSSKNHASLPSSSFRLQSSVKQINERFACSRVSTSTTAIRSLSYRDASAAADAANERSSAYPRPAEIQWKKELCNSVQLIGVVGTDVLVNQVSSGKVVARTRLAFRKSSTETSWINLTFWDEMAHIAHQHLQKGQQIYVSGRLVSDSVETEDGKQQTYYKVVVQQINFIEKSFSSPVPLYEEGSSSASSGRKFDNAGANGNGKLSTEALWQAFFASPLEWWDNRKNKKTPKYPDFKHKDTGEALWVESRYNPSWVKSQLEILDSRMETFHSDNSDRRFEFNGNDFPSFH